MSYSLKLTVGQVYSISGFETEEEVHEFMRKYHNREEALERDFDDLPYYATKKHTCFDNYFAEIIEHEEVGA